MKQKTKIPLDVSIYIRYLYQDKGVRVKEILERFPDYSQASIYRHVKKPIGSKEVFDHRHLNKGRPQKLDLRDERSILRQIPKLRETAGSFTAVRIRFECGLENIVSARTVRRMLNRNNYHYLQSRKKGLLTRKDLVLRHKFALKISRRLPANFWKEGISFYLDGVAFTHKYNPSDQARSTRSMAWRKKCEGLSLNCTAKGSKAGTGGKMAHFIVAIAYGHGVVCCEQYTDNMSGKLFASFVREHFKEIFSKSANPRGMLFLQDGDPSQNSKLARDAISSVGARLFSIPARSPDLNPIENMFNLVRTKLHGDALDKNITRETFEQFSSRVKETMENFSIDLLDRTIESMNGRIKNIIGKKGLRLKY